MTTRRNSSTGAGSVSSATEAFLASLQHADAGADAERVSAIVSAILAAIHDVVLEHGVTYPEFVAARQWLTGLVELCLTEHDLGG
jgi:catechol 1,2-dioxygenase